MNVKALRFESRFSLAPNCLGYCGNKTAGEKLKKCLKTGDCEGVGKELKNFIVLYPYLKTIAQITKLPVFSYPVIEGYWLGNNILEKVEDKHYKILLENFEQQGVPKLLIKELRKNKPKKFIPNHLFQVLHVGVGRASNSVTFNLESINNCMIRWGKVVSIKGERATLKLNSLKNNSRLALTIVNKVLKFEKTFIPGLKNEDTVAVHWNTIIKKLTKEEEKKLAYWTEAVLRNLY
jgi:hypothetical protein